MSIADETWPENVEISGTVLWHQSDIYCSCGYIFTSFHQLKKHLGRRLLKRHLNNFYSVSFVEN
jgi:hypothetical protein